MFPNDRDGGYDADKVYDTSASAWVAQSAQLPKSGEKYTWLIIINDISNIYIGKY